jgi:hypothetical protein
MVNAYGPGGIGVALAGAVLGVFIARELNVNRLVILGIGVAMTLFVNHPMIQLAGAVVTAIVVSRYIGEEIYQLS